MSKGYADRWLVGLNWEGGFFRWEQRLGQGAYGGRPIYRSRKGWFYIAPGEASVYLLLFLVTFYLLGLPA